MDWFAPPVQPFLVDGGLASSLLLPVDGRNLPDELRDTYWIYGAEADVPRVWLSEAEFMALAVPCGPHSSMPNAGWTASSCRLSEAGSLLSASPYDAKQMGTGSSGGPPSSRGTKRRY